jgi:hypothetical protein
MFVMTPKEWKNTFHEVIHSVKIKKENVCRKILEDLPELL